MCCTCPGTRATDVQSLWELLITPFALPFMGRALAVLVLLSIAAGLLGLFVNLRRLEFLGDGLVHAVFPGVVIGFAIAGTPGLITGGVIAAVAAAVVLTLITRRAVPNDSAVAVVLTSLFSIGVLVVSRQDDYVGQLSQLLFGHLLTVTAADVAITAVLAGISLLLVVVGLKEQLLRAFDSAGAAALGYRVLALDLMLNIAMALFVVAAARALGTLLVLALLIIPVATARLLVGGLRTIVVVAVVVGILGGWSGLVVSFAASVHGGVSLPGSATVVLAMLALFALALLVAGLRTVAGARARRAAEHDRAPVIPGGRLADRVLTAIGGGRIRGDHDGDGPAIPTREGGER